MWTEYLALMVMAMLLRVSFELNRPASGNPDAGANTPGLTPREQEWADKAVQRYAAAQEKKWRRWNEAMFERSG